MSWFYHLPITGKVNFSYYPIHRLFYQLKQQNGDNIEGYKDEKKEQNAKAEMLRQPGIIMVIQPILEIIADALAGSTNYHSDKPDMNEIKDV